MVTETQYMPQSNSVANAGVSGGHYTRDASSKDDFKGAPRYARFAALHAGLISRKNIAGPRAWFPSGPFYGGRRDRMERIDGMQSDPAKVPTVAPLKPARS